jgi:hypothetical protein
MLSVYDDGYMETSAGTCALISQETNRIESMGSGAMDWWEHHTSICPEAVSAIANLLRHIMATTLQQECHESIPLACFPITLYRN